jgi:hypothetical protein
MGKQVERRLGSALVTSTLPGAGIDRGRAGRFLNSRDSPSLKVQISN